MKGFLSRGMSAAAALRLEFGVIGLGVLALFMIFQPFSLWIFSIGCGLVVLAALANNLLPLAQRGVTYKSVVTAALIIAVVFCTALLLAILAAHLYGVFFLKAPAVTTSLRPPGPPFWEYPLVWLLLLADACFAAGVYLLSRRS